MVRKKYNQNLSNRGLRFDDAEQVFNGECLTFEDTRIDYGEPRFVTFGLLEGRQVVIVHTPRGDNIRIISMRKANEPEQKIYTERLEEAQQNVDQNIQIQSLKKGQREEVDESAYGQGRVSELIDKYNLSKDTPAQEAQKSKSKSGQSQK